MKNKFKISFDWIKSPYKNMQKTFSETFGLGPAASLTAFVFLFTVFVGAAFLFFFTAPPKTITIAAGEENSRFYTLAEKYEKVLARSGVKLNIVKTHGSLDNIKMLNDHSSRVDIAFVQTGVAKENDLKYVHSLGSISYAPVYIFYRGERNVDILSGFAGKRIAVGEEGTGAHVIALEMLAMNGIVPGGSTTLLSISATEAQKLLSEGKIEAAFMSSDSTPSPVMRQLLRSESIKVFSFAQADAYIRRITHMNKITLPKGSMDFGKNLPGNDVILISPTIELVARSNLNPAISDLLLEAAAEIHGRKTLFNLNGEFPRASENEYKISPDATRYYKSGKSFLYRYFPFWLASIINRVLVVIVPMILILIPGIKSIPALFRWKIRLRIFRWYRALLVLEANVTPDITPEKREELFNRLEEIEQSVNNLKIPVSYADLFYALRGHIALVHQRLLGKKGAIEHSRA